MQKPDPSGLPQGMHTCPTRADGAQLLFAHVVSEPMCAKRQEDRYHKCFSCVHNAALAPIAAVPPAGEGEPIRELVPHVPAKKKAAEKHAV